MWQAVPVELRSQIKANSLEIVLKEERCDRSHPTQDNKGLADQDKRPTARSSGTRARASSRLSLRLSLRLSPRSGPSCFPSSISLPLRPTRPTGLLATSSFSPCSTPSQSAFSRSCRRCLRPSARD